MMAEELIKTTIKRLGISAHQYGFRYLAMAVNEVMETPEYVYKMMYVYERIASSVCSTPRAVEGAIRAAILSGWKRRNPAFAADVFGNDTDKVPANGVFIANVTDYVETKVHAEKLLKGGEG